MTPFEGVPPRTPGPGVGIVVVSHSRALARAAVALAAEMLHGRQVRIAVAAGLDETTFGTDAVQIRTAMEEVDGPDGVVVLMDLGSAVLSAELALDLLDDPAVRDRVVLCPAPLVEGLVVAAVAASGGAPRAEVAAEARAALMGKAAHLGSPDDEAADPAATTRPDVVAEFTVANAHGLHARPAARLVAEVRTLDATVLLRNATTGAGPVPASSLSRVATLGALAGHVVEVHASGPQANEAVEHVLALADRRFDEPADGPGNPPSAAAGAGTGPGAGPRAASPGLGIGPVRQLVPLPVVVDPTPAGPPAQEWRALVQALADVRREVERLRAAAVREVGVEEARIFDAHLMLLTDSELLGAARSRIGSGCSAASAWSLSVTDVEASWAGLADSYLRGRAADVRAVGEQVLRSLAGVPPQPPQLDGVVVARDLTPAEASMLDRQRVVAVVLAAGSATSHAAILARSQGIPAVVGAGPSVLSVPDGTVVVVDGSEGTLVVDPAPDVLRAYERAAADLAQRDAAHVVEAAQPATTADGVTIEVTANLGSVTDARTARWSGADASGLVRTEFLFLGRDQAPTVDEQVRVYLAMAEAMDGRRLTLRTLDVGGDKPLPYVPAAAEDNPFLGLRGIRLSLARRDLLRDQLSAVCAVARRTSLAVMFPMVTTVDELLQARQLLQEAAGPEGVPSSLRVGMMVEVPAAALRIESFLPHVDFVSIGTNDLTQYTLAAERGNPAVADLADPLDPAVLQLVARVAQAATGRAHVSVCGEAAADPAAVPVLVGLGVDELSVSPPAVPGVKAAVRGLDSAGCRALADRCLAAGSAAEVRELVQRTPLRLVAAVDRSG